MSHDIQVFDGCGATEPERPVPDVAYNITASTVDGRRCGFLAVEGHRQWFVPGRDGAAEFLPGKAERIAERLNKANPAFRWDAVLAVR